MKVLIDAQLPRRFAHWLRTMGCDALHTLDLPEGNHTSDAAIIERADQEQRIVVTKDADFVNSFLVYHQPQQLLLISTGNITNNDLESVFAAHLDAIVTAFDCNYYSFIEITRTAMIVHE